MGKGYHDKPFEQDFRGLLDYFSSDVDNSFVHTR